MKFKRQIYGLMIEFENPSDLVRAARETFRVGFRYFDAYTPYPIEGLAEKMGFRRTLVPLIVLIGGILGCATGYALQYWISVVDYPLNIGGRPFHSWPAFIPVTFELTILFAAISAVLGMLALNGLPMPNHPVFNIPRFELASRSHFFLCVEAKDPKFDRIETENWLKSLGAKEVFEVEN
jgi:hypothetical protein